jgi:hypothetical protein
MGHILPESDIGGERNKGGVPDRFFLAGNPVDSAGQNQKQCGKKQKVP